MYIAVQRETVDKETFLMKKLQKYQSGSVNYVIN